jgi:hypothetical protein
MPTGILSTDQFLDLIAHGSVLKDVGAGAPHGRLTHRLQWHALMSAMTAKFTVPIESPWKSSPLSLYCSLGSAGMVNGPKSVWGTVFDIGGSSPSANFRAPDRLHAAILKSSKLSLQVNLSRKRDEDARNLAAALRTHLQEADRGTGPLSSWVAKGKGAPLILAHQKIFGMGRAFTYDELYDFIDQQIFRRTMTNNYPNAYLYIAKRGTSDATRRFLEKRKLPTNLDLLGKSGFYPPDDSTIQSRIRSSLSSLNWAEANSIDWAGFDKRLK